MADTTGVKGSTLAVVQTHAPGDRLWLLRPSAPLPKDRNLMLDVAALGTVKSVGGVAPDDQGNVALDLSTYLSLLLTTLQQVAGPVLFKQALQAPDVQLVGTDALAAYDSLYKLSKAFAALEAGAPGALDTLKEIADQLASDEAGAAALLAAVNQLKALVPSDASSSNQLISRGATFTLLDNFTFNTLPQLTFGRYRGPFSGSLYYQQYDYIPWNGRLLQRKADGYPANQVYVASEWTDLFPTAYGFRGAWATQAWYKQYDLIITPDGTKVQYAKADFKSTNTYLAANWVDFPGGGGGTAYNDTDVRNLIAGNTTSIELLRARVFGRNRGEWAASTDYLQYDFVTSGGTQYYANAAFTSGTAFVASNWTVGAYAASGVWQYIGASTNYNSCLGPAAGITLGSGAVGNTFFGSHRGVSLAGPNVGNVLEFTARNVTLAAGANGNRVGYYSYNVAFGANTTGCVVGPLCQNITFQDNCQNVTVLRTNGNSSSDPFTVPAGTVDATYVNGVLQTSGGGAGGAATYAERALSPVINFDIREQYAEGPLTADFAFTLGTRGNIKNATARYVLIPNGVYSLTASADFDQNGSPTYGSTEYVIVDAFCPPAPQRPVLTFSKRALVTASGGGSATGGGTPTPAATQYGYQFKGPDQTLTVPNSTGLFSGNTPFTLAFRARLTTTNKYYLSQDDGSARNLDVLSQNGELAIQLTSPSGQTLYWHGALPADTGSVNWYFFPWDGTASASALAIFRDAAVLPTSFDPSGSGFSGINPSGHLRLGEIFGPGNSSNCDFFDECYLIPGLALNASQRAEIMNGASPLSFASYLAGDYHFQQSLADASTHGRDLTATDPLYVTAP